MKFTYIAFCALAAVATAGIVYAQTGQNKSTTTTTHSSGQNSKYSYAIVNGDGSIHSSGSWHSDEWKALKERSKQETLYVRKDGQMYEITDKNVIGQVRKAYEPLAQIGKEMGALGQEQGKLGKEQGEMGKKYGEIAKEISEAAREHGQNMGKDEKAREKFEQAMARLHEMQAELGKKHEHYGALHQEFGKKHAALGKKMSEAAKAADAKSTKLIDDAFAKGLAKKI